MALVLNNVRLADRECRHVIKKLRTKCTAVFDSIVSMKNDPLRKQFSSMMRELRRHVPEIRSM